MDRTGQLQESATKCDILLITKIGHVRHMHKLLVRSATLYMYSEMIKILVTGKTVKRISAMELSFLDDTNDPAQRRLA